MSNINFDSCSITAKTSVLANSSKKYLQIELEKRPRARPETAVRNARVEDVVCGAEDVVRDPA